MRFMVDECTGPAVAKWLRAQGYEVFSVYDEARGVDDKTLLQKAFAENWILITNDKHFGEKIYRERHPHRGVVLLRLEDERSVTKIAVLQRLLQRYGERLTDQFVVVSEAGVRFARE